MTYRNCDAFVPAAETEDEIARLADVDEILDLVEQERKTLRQQRKRYLLNIRNSVLTFNI